MPLTQKEIDNLEIKPKRYMISVGEPKELYIRVSPSGKKVFYLRAEKYKEFITLGECQKGVLNVSNARLKANELLKAMFEGSFVAKKDKVFTLGMAKEHYANTKGQNLSLATLKKRNIIFDKYIKATLADKSINELCRSDFLAIFDLMHLKSSIKLYKEA